MLSKRCFSSRKRVNKKYLAFYYILSQFDYLISNMQKRDNLSIQAPLPISYGSAYPAGAKTPRRFHNLLGQSYTTSLQLFIYKKTAKSVTVEPKHSTLHHYKVW